MKTLGMGAGTIHKRRRSKVRLTQKRGGNIAEVMIAFRVEVIEKESEIKRKRMTTFIDRPISKVGFALINLEIVCFACFILGLG